MTWSLIGYVSGKISIFFLTTSIFAKRFLCFEIWTWSPALNLSVLYYSGIKTDICITRNINSFILIIMQIVLLFTSTNSGSLSIYTFFDIVLVFHWTVLQLLIFLLYELNNFITNILGTWFHITFIIKLLYLQPMSTISKYFVWFTAWFFHCFLILSLKEITHTYLNQ